MNAWTRYSITALIGIVSGLIAGMFGTSTAYALFFGLMFTGVLKSYRHTIGTVMFTILPPLSFMAVYEFYKEGLVDVHIGLFLMPILAVGSWLGAKYQTKFTVSQSETLMGCFLIFIALSLFYTAWRGGSVGRVAKGV
jgi:hypothetical protein